MGVVDKKRDVFGKIAALRTLTEGYPKLNLNASLPSISVNTNSSDFLIDLLKSLIGFDELQEIVVNIITYNLSDIEIEIKNTLKRELKKLVSCGIDPSIPSYLDYSTGSGVDIELKKVDFFNIMKVAPDSEYGGMLYDDIPAGASSTDFNTMLYDVVQSQAEGLWGQSTNGNDILAIDFNPSGVTANNVINIKTSSTYSPSGPKTLTDLNNDYIDSVKLFGSEKMINNIIDSIFGSISVAIDKSQEQLENEGRISSAFESILNADNNAVVDDSYFEFGNEETKKIEDGARDRKKGIIKLDTSTASQSSISAGSLQDALNPLSGTISGSEAEKDAINNAFDSISDKVSTDLDNIKDKYANKLNFIELILKKLMISIINFIISPKIIAIFVLNYKIIYGLNEDYDDGIEFMKKNKTLITNIAKSIRDEVLKILLARALKEITTLVSAAAAKSATAKAKQQSAQLLSLLGIPQNIIRMISGLSSGGDIDIDITI